MARYFIEIDSKLAYNTVVAGLEKSGYKWSSGREVRDFAPGKRFFFCLHPDELILTWSAIHSGSYLREGGFKDGKHLFPLIAEDNV